MPLNPNQLLDLMRQQSMGQVADFDPMGTLPGRGPRSTPPPLARTPIAARGPAAAPPVAPPVSAPPSPPAGGGFRPISEFDAAAPPPQMTFPASSPPPGLFLSPTDLRPSSPGPAGPAAPAPRTPLVMNGAFRSGSPQDNLQYQQFDTDRRLSQALGGRNGQIPSLQEFISRNEVRGPAHLYWGLGASPEEINRGRAQLGQTYNSILSAIYAGPEGPTQSAARMGAVELQGRERDTQDRLATEAERRGAFERSPEGLRHAAALAQASTPGGIPGFNAGNVVQPQTGPDAPLQDALARARSVEGYTDPATGRIRPDRMNNFITSFLNNVGMEDVQRNPQRYRAFLESVLDPMAVDAFARTSPGIFGRDTPITRGAAVLRSAPAGRSTPIAPVAPPGMTQPGFIPMGW